MTDNIFGARFVDSRQPAWHGKGQVLTQPTNAIDAWGIVGSELKQLRMPVFVQGKKEAVQLPYDALLSYLPGVHDGGVKCNGGTLFTHGVVTKQYEEIFHRDFVELWHRATDGANIETMGLLGKGDTLFMSVQMPTISIAGDETIPYLFGFSPLDGKTAITCKDTLVRVVCQNTCNIALRGTSEFTLRAVHNTGVKTEVETWLREIWLRQSEVIATIKEAAKLLASRPARHSDEVRTVTDAIYPISDTPPDTQDLDILASWEKFNKRQSSHRFQVASLFDCSPTQTPATKGTLWGLYNAVVEYEDFARPRTTAASRFVGESAKRKERAFDVCMSMA